MIEDKTIEDIIRDHNSLMCQKYSQQTKGDVSTVTAQKLYKYMLNDRINSSIQTLHSVSNILTGSEDFRIGAGIKCNFSMGEIYEIRKVLENLEKSYRDQAIDEAIAVVKGDK